MSLVSIVVPVYNEEGNVLEMYSQLTGMADTSGLTCEFIFVDDGSSDDSVSRLREACSEDSRVTIVVLRKNFGQTAAMSAGFDYASGDIVVVLDGDLQNDPAEIPRMVAKLEEGYDVVAGWRKDRKDKNKKRAVKKVQEKAFPAIVVVDSGLPDLVNQFVRKMK